MNGKLDSNLLGNFGIDGAGSNIKSIQRGVVTFSTTIPINITISSVNFASSIVILTFDTGTNIGYADKVLVKGKLTSGTNLELTKYTAQTDYPTVYWQVIEFQNIKSLQQGEFIYSSGNTVTISAVNTAKSVLFFSYSSSNSTDSGSNAMFCSGGITSPTQLIFNGKVWLYIDWYVVEFN